MAQASLAPLAFEGGSNGSASSASLLPSSPVDVNQASAEELRKCVPKVGTVLAQRIVEFREQNGPFKSADDLMHVPGIGKRLAMSIFPGAPSESGLVEVRRNTLPPPWGAPLGLAAPDVASAPKTDAPAANDAHATRKSIAAPEPAPARTAPARVLLLALAVVGGLVLGIWANTQSVKRPTRELSERIDVTQTENRDTRSELDRQRALIQETKDEVKSLASRVESESTERKADHAKLTHDVSTLHDTVKKSTQSNEARIQRLRETLTEIELYHGANIAHAPAH
jgi:competence ComEA-like helix-hairpin-helix protein